MSKEIESRSYTPVGNRFGELTWPMAPKGKGAVKGGNQIGMGDVFAPNMVFASPEELPLRIERRWFDPSRRAEVSEENYIELRRRLMKLNQQELLALPTERLQEKLVVFRTGIRIYDIEDKVVQLRGHIIALPFTRDTDWPDNKEQFFSFVGNLSKRGDVIERATCYYDYPEDGIFRKMQLGWNFRVDPLTAIRISNIFAKESKIY